MAFDFEKSVFLHVANILLVIAVSFGAVLSNARADSVRDADGNWVTISSTPFQSRSGTDEAPFTRYDGSEFGLQQKNLFSPRDFYPPFFNGSGLSSGDIDRDGWPDVVSANGHLVVIHMNQQGRRFESLEVDITGIADATIFNIALVDLDGNGWLDLFGTTYLQGNFYLLNDGGRFSAAGLRQPPRGDAVVSLTASFGDIDRDGDLDAVIGNWFAGASKKHPPPQSQNVLWENQDGFFTASTLTELTGETLSTLLSDWSGDGWLDLIVGNDFQAPDFYYRGDGDGAFELVERSDKIVPYTTESTMSIDSADFDNDLDLDIFIDQITARATGPSAQVQVLALEHYCDDIVIETERDRCRANMATREGFFYGANHRPTHVRKCALVPDALDEQACVGTQVMMTAQRFEKPELCNSIPEAETRSLALCQNYFEPVVSNDTAMLEESIPQRMNQNVLLTWNSLTGAFTDEAERLGVGFTGWSWNGRFADVDNDEWQDIFVAAGSWFRATSSGTTANFFFHNEAGKRFTDQTDAYGFQNFMIVSAYTIVDFDRDGDLDFVTNSINGPLWLLQNNSANRNAVEFQLQDQIGNRDGIGSKFIIHYGADSERHQLRELKASGGYLSYDEPIAHFGLGEYTSIDRLEIEWSTGGSTIIPGPFEAGHLYSLKRSKFQTEPEQ